MQREGEYCIIILFERVARQRESSLSGHVLHASLPTPRINKPAWPAGRPSGWGGLEHWSGLIVFLSDPRRTFPLYRLHVLENTGSTLRYTIHQSTMNPISEEELFTNIKKKVVAITIFYFMDQYTVRNTL